jgi:hypothetical protein
MRRFFSVAADLFSAGFVILVVLAVLATNGGVAADEPLSRPPVNDSCAVPNGLTCPNPQGCSGDECCCQCQDFAQSRILCECEIVYECGCDNEDPGECG